LILTGSFVLASHRLLPTFPTNDVKIGNCIQKPVSTMQRRLREVATMFLGVLRTDGGERLLVSA
jgi:hypothetical protein